MHCIISSINDRQGNSRFTAFLDSVLVTVQLARFMNTDLCNNGTAGDF